MGTAINYSCTHNATVGVKRLTTEPIKHPVPDLIKPSFEFLTSGHSDAQTWASECPVIKNYKWRLNPVWHRMLYSCTHMATVASQG